MISPEVKAALDLVQPLLDAHVAGALTRRLDSLAKSSPALGRLDDLVLHCGIVQGTAQPVAKRKAVYVFCGDHGVVEEGVMHGPGLASSQRIRQILRGGDPLSVLCRRIHIEPVVIDCGVAGEPLPGAVQAHTVSAASNIARLPALMSEETNAAILFGVQTAIDAAARFDAVGIAHIGDGASTAAAALLSVISGHEAAETCPHSDDQPESAHHRMVSAVRTAAGRHSADCVDPFGALRCLGGWDIAAMTGFILGAAQKRLPVVVDGFVSGTAALVARSLAPDSLDAAIFAHESAEPAHALLHDVLGVEAYLNLHLHPDSGCAAPLLLNMIELALHLVDESALAGAVPDAV
jgi:nicotinate-nucleotide--dimethylbenzimidazole phosphoribosyltransferase